LRYWKLTLFALLYILVGIIIVPSFTGSNYGAVNMPRINLGLDLRGGSQLLLGIEFESFLKDQYSQILSDVRKAMRTDKIGYMSLESKASGISFKMRNHDDFSKIKSTVRKIDNRLSLEKNGEDIEIFFNDAAISDLKKSVVEQSIEIVRRRVDETGVTEPIIQPRGLSNIDLQVPGLSSPDQLKSLLGKTAKLTFQLVDEDSSRALGVTKVVPSESVLVSSKEGGDIVLKREVLLTGNDLVDARTVFDHGSPAISFKFSNYGAKKFADITKESTGRRFAILFDGEVISAPVIKEPILSGSGIISGKFTTDSANELAMLLRAGALPAELTILEERTIGPSLGIDSIESGKVSGYIAFALVAGFMIVAYGVLGLFANIALIANMALLFAMLCIMQATLTLPGIAGIVLTIGMAVDANILIFERIREEIKLGYAVNTSIVKGFQNAFNAIFDSNITTLIVALMLFLFGTGPVKGFAVTLSLGIIASMISNIGFAKHLLLFWSEKFHIKSIKV